MVRHAWWIIAVLLLVGCNPPQHDPRPKKASTVTSDKKLETVDPETKSPDVIPEKKPDDKPADPPQTFVPPEDKELAALKDVATDELVSRMGDEKQRELATRALIQRGAEAAGPLTKALESKDPQARAAAAFALGQLGKDGAAAADALKKMAESDDSEIARDAAAFALDAMEGK